MKKFYGLKYSVLFGLILLYGNVSHAQTDLYISGTQLWNTATANWGTASVGPFSTLWSNGNYADLEGATSTVTVSGFNPRVFKLSSTSTSTTETLQGGSTLYLGGGGTTPSIDVVNTKTLNLSTVLDGGLGFDLNKSTSTGTLTLGAISNKIYGTITIYAGTLTFNNSSLTPGAALRLNPINIGASGTLSCTNLLGGLGTDVRLGTLNGAGTLSNTNSTIFRGFYQFLTQNGSSSATIIAGTSGISISGLTVRGIGEYVQTFTGNTSGIIGSLTVAGNELNDGNYSNNVTLSGGSTNTINDSAIITGGKLTFDNSTNNVTTRIGTVATNTLTFNGGGCFTLISNSSGTTQSIGTAGAVVNGGGTAKAASLNLNAGANKIVLQTPSGGGGTHLIFGGNTTANFSLRDQTFTTIDFTATGNTNLGGGGTNPSITFSGGFTPILDGSSGNNSNMLSNSASAGTVGWATVNGNTWATYGANGITALPFISASVNGDLESHTGNKDVVDFAPTGTVTLTKKTAPASLRITPNGGTLSLNGFTITANVIMLNGTTNFTISGAGAFPGNGGTKYIYVLDANTTLSTDMTIQLGTNPFNKVGLGFLELTGITQQVTASATNRFNILQGTLRANNTQFKLDGTTDGTSLGFRGGVLEISNGSNGTGTSADFRRSLGGNSTNGAVNWDNGVATERGSGGFSAYFTDASVNIGGLAIPTTLTWGSANFVQDGYSLIFGSTKSDHRLTFLNPIVLDAAAGNQLYTAREIYVYKNPTPSTNDKTQLAGVISGTANSDLVKTGPGELELNATNTYAGNTIVQAGTLTVYTGALPFTTHVILLGGILQLDASQTITDLTMNTGSTLNLNGNNLTITGDFTYNGGTISGTGTVIFNGTSQQYINGQSVSFSDAVTINNSSGVVLTNTTYIPNTLTLTSGTFTNGSYLTLGGFPTTTIYRTGGILNSVPNFGTSVNVVYNGYSSAITTGNELPLSTTILNNLTSNNSNNVILNANATSNGTMALNSGAFNINDKTLTINNASTTSGTLSGSSASNLIINGTANTLYFTAGSQLLHNLTLNNTATASLGTALSIVAGSSFGTVSIPNNGLLTTSDNLTLKSDINGTACVAQNTTSSTYISGNVTIERYINSQQQGSFNGRSWRCLTAPIVKSSTQTINAAWQEGYATTAATIAGLSPTPPTNAGYGTEITNTIATPSGLANTGYDQAVTNNPSLLFLNDAGNQWAAPPVPLGTKIPITTYEGYLLFVRGDRTVLVKLPTFPTATVTTLRVKGALNEGTVTKTIPVGLPSGNYAIVGNPFASEIFLDSLFRWQQAAVGSNYVMWDPLLGGSSGVGGYSYCSDENPPGSLPFYSSFNANVTNFTPGRIESSQAFFLSGLAGATYHFNELYKTGQSVLVFRPADVVVSSFATQLSSVNSDSSTDLDDGVLELYNSQYSDSVNWLEDAQKIPNPGESLAIRRDGKSIAIEKRQPIIITDTIFLSITHMKQQEYQFTIFASDMLQPGMVALLEDNFTGTTRTLSLTDTTKVNFAVTSDASSQGANRFQIVFGFANGGSLPVTYTSIKAWQQINNIEVQWNVQNEQNIKSYEVEKSIDGKTFVTAASVNATGATVYNWTDANLLSGENYYRIVSIDNNGALQYSETVKLKIGTNAPGIAVYPNPIKQGVIGLQMNNMPEGKYSIRLINNIGQVMFNKNISHVTGSSSETISTNNIAKGIYNLEVTSPGNDKKDIKLLY